MIDVLVEASSPDLQAEIADLLRDHSQIRLIESNPDRAGGDESKPQPDVVLAAVGAQDRAGYDLFGWDAAGVPIILLVENPARRTSETLPAGVRGVLPQNISAAEIVGAIEAVAVGLYVLHPSDVDSLAILRPREAEAAEPFADHSVEPLVEHLTQREIEVLQLLSEGLGNKEIATRLNISEHTAKFHVASIMGKLGAMSRTEAVTLGIRHGLVMI
jgi:DNA-binding NarL/FixJ family response regulator